MNRQLLALALPSSSAPKSYIGGSKSSAGQIVDIGSEVNKNGFFGYTCIWQLVSNVVSMALIVGAIAFFLYLVWGGIDWLTSGGDKTKLQSAQTRISSALIGLTIIATSWAIFQVVLYFFGIDISQICSNNPLGS